jgi:hypothetical protein
MLNIVYISRDPQRPGNENEAGRVVTVVYGDPDGVSYSVLMFPC